jgi:hypothetical protein
MRAAMAAELQAGRRPREAAEKVIQEYGIGAVTARIDSLYEELALARGRQGWAARRAGRPALAEGGSR